jgi:class 3 adenylate cyclase
LWTAQTIYVYAGYCILFGLILAQLPGGFVAGLGGWIMGMIFIPAVCVGVWQAMAVLFPFLGLIPILILTLGGTGFEVMNALAWVGGGVGFAIGFAYLLDVVNRRAFDLERRLDQEKRRSEALLLNILPVEIAERLKANEEPLADTHETVSVLFADLVGFTEIAQTLSADALVNLLNDLFSRFDKLAAKHGAEKIKTIGDAYMVATGLQGSVADHAERIADLALDMQQAFADFRKDNDVDLKLRIGVHSGTVIAGVIGKQKFSYDLWGDTVNVANRMEAAGLPDRIQISTRTRSLLPDSYRTSPRGEVEIKGHQAQETFLLEGRG